MVDFAILESSKPMEELSVDIWVVPAWWHTIGGENSYYPPSFVQMDEGRPSTRTNAAWTTENQFGMAAMLSTTSYIL